MKEAVVHEVGKEKEEREKLHLVEREEVKIIHEMGGICGQSQNLMARTLGTGTNKQTRTSSMIKSTFNILPSPANLVWWNIQTIDECRCGEKVTGKHDCDAMLDRTSPRCHKQAQHSRKRLRDIIGKNTQKWKSMGGYTSRRREKDIRPGLPIKYT